MNKKHFIFECKEMSENVLHFIGSNDAVDRSGETMTHDGWELDNYQKNPVFLYAHDYSTTPIGKAVQVSTGMKGLEFDIQFVPKEIDPFAEKVRQLYKGGYLNAVSVGFITKQTQSNADGTLAILKKELLELSAVPVPCNPQALQNAYQKGIIDDADMKRLEGEKKVDDIAMQNFKSVVESYLPDTMNRATSQLSESLKEIGSALKTK